MRVLAVNHEEGAAGLVAGVRRVDGRQQRGNRRPRALLTAMGYGFLPP